MQRPCLAAVQQFLFLPLQLNGLTNWKHNSVSAVHQAFFSMRVLWLQRLHTREEHTCTCISAASTCTCVATYFKFNSDFAWVAPKFCFTHRRENSVFLHCLANKIISKVRFMVVVSCWNAFEFGLGGDFNRQQVGLLCLVVICYNSLKLVTKI